MKRAIIKERFTDSDRFSGSLLVTPKSFKTVKDWTGYQVEGLSYYVDLACSKGAAASEQKQAKRTLRKSKSDK